MKRWNFQRRRQKCDKNLTRYKKGEENYKEKERKNECYSLKIHITTRKGQTKLIVSEHIHMKDNRESRRGVPGGILWTLSHRPFSEKFPIRTLCMVLSVMARSLFFLRRDPASWYQEEEFKRLGRKSGGCYKWKGVKG